MSQAKDKVKRLLKKITSKGDAKRGGKGSPNLGDVASAIENRKKKYKDQLDKIK